MKQYTRAINDTSPSLTSSRTVPTLRTRGLVNSISKYSCSREKRANSPRRLLLFDANDLINNMPRWYFPLIKEKFELKILTVPKFPSIERK